MIVLKSNLDSNLMSRLRNKSMGEVHSLEQRNGKQQLHHLETDPNTPEICNSGRLQYLQAGLQEEGISAVVLLRFLPSSQSFTPTKKLDSPLTEQLNFTLFQICDFFSTSRVSSQLTFQGTNISMHRKLPCNDFPVMYI